MSSTRPRQRDVAALAGVSQAIVSAVINHRVNGSMRISPATEQRVWAAVRELGYVPNPIARNLAGGRNHILGVFTYEPFFPLHQQISYYPFLVGIEREAEAQNYNLLLFTQANDTNGTRAIYRDGINCLQLADGAVLFGKQEQQDELSRLLQERFPFVFVGRRQAPAGEISYVVAAHVESTRELIERVIGIGHRRIAYVRYSADTESEHDRESGFRLAHQRFGIPLDERLIRSVHGDDITAEFVGQLFRAGVTAIITEDTEIARRVQSHARLVGKIAPRDYSLAALGDTMTAMHVDPSIATLIVPRQEIGARAVRLLIERIAHPEKTDAAHIYVPCTLSLGTTIAAPP